MNEKTCDCGATVLVSSDSPDLMLLTPRPTVYVRVPSTKGEDKLRPEPNGFVQHVCESVPPEGRASKQKRTAKKKGDEQE